MIERAVIEAASALRYDREPFVIATVVGVRGDAVRPVGARMIVGRDAWMAGSVSGGAVEHHLARKAWSRTERGPTVVDYAIDGDGSIDVLLERSRDEGVDPLAAIARCVSTQRRGVLVTITHVLADSGVAVGARLALDVDHAATADPMPPALHRRLLDEARARLAADGGAGRGGAEIVTYPDGVRAVFELLVPLPRLFVFGHGHDAVPVVQLGQSIGWEVVVCERLADAIAAVDRSDRAAAIVMHHHARLDRNAISALLASRARYIGVAGPRARTERLLGELGVSAAAIDPRIHAPVGRALGAAAETPAELALAIIAEIQATFVDQPPRRDTLAA
jgi:xanthine/CO dehydrogenase XdhC/CoxF family maturation factor